MKYYRQIMIALRLAASLMILYIIASCTRPPMQASNPMTEHEIYATPGIQDRILVYDRVNNMFYEVRFASLPPFKVREILLLRRVDIEKEKN